MVEPKLFYRNFDKLLREIRHKKQAKNYIFAILDEVRNNFGEQLHIGRLHLFEDRGDRFVRVHVENGEQDPNAPFELSANLEAVKLILKNGSYLFDAPDQADIGHQFNLKPGSMTLAGILIRGLEERWIAIFELLDGWVHEEILFCFNAVRTSLNQRLFSEAIRTELEQAALIQKSLLPAESPNIEGYEIAVKYKTTEIVGGDLYDFFELDNNVFGICIGDASGHGIPAALLVRDVVIGMRIGIEKHMKMLHAFQKLNNVIYKSTYSSRFISLFYGEIEKDGNLIYVNAGHPAPFIVKGGNVRDLEATGLIIGALPEIPLHRSFARIDPGSVFVLYSDGIFERENAREELFSIERLKRLVIDNQEKNAEELVQHIYDQVFEYGNRAKWDDDVTLIVIKRQEEDA
jgi:sigma-B regulation protein RsbU (phosphoserine phosphatase)